MFYLIKFHKQEVFPQNMFTLLYVPDYLTERRCKDESGKGPSPS